MTYRRYVKTLLLDGFNVNEDATKLQEACDLAQGARLVQAIQVGAYVHLIFEQERKL